MRSRRSKKEVKEIIASIPSYLTTNNDPYGIGEAYWSAVANSLYTQIHQAALVKSYGFPDDLGNRWDPLKDATKAYKKKKLRGAMNLPNANPLRPSLTAGQDAQWRKIFVLIYIKGKPTPERAALAAATAWKTLKDQGAKTLLGMARSINARILYESGALVESYAPTNTNPYQPTANQKYRRNGKSLVIGSNIPYAKHHKNTRPIWPPNPRPWIAKAKQAGMSAMLEKLKEVL